ncbi:uncharacterized protein LOC111385932, partial [Olea europaea var. sylvestris]|uniref:uncharacterized protein LOC111385932 n=1 Tax=Olea europaea var. sylvestris TaxID=158386 RepID=UPI000C1D5B30
MDIKDFRPNSLVSGMYKIIAKNAFVKGRQILDSILIANECINSRLRQRVPGMLFLVNDTPESHFWGSRGLRQRGSFVSNGDVEHFRNLRRLLLCVGAISRMKINLGKSKAIIVGEVDNLEGLATTLGCRVEQLPMTYLGLPLGARFTGIHIWDSIVKRVERRLVGWKRLYLSKGGRLSPI